MFKDEVYNEQNGMDEEQSIFNVDLEGYDNVNVLYRARLQNGCQANHVEKGCILCAPSW